MAPPIARRVHDQRGDFNVFMALGLAIMILLLGGMSTDLWHVVAEARTLDAASDSAAAAGSSGIDPASLRVDPGQPQLDQAMATQLALSNLASQAGLPGSPNPQIVVTPTNITVTLHGQVHLTLLQIFLGKRTIPLTSTATSGPQVGAG
jgi:Flp pilus assembly protein TadG